MAVVIQRVDITGVAEALAYLNDVNEALKAPTEGVQKATNAVAAQWLVNFEREGGEYRQWRGLAESTQQKRARQGYGPSHPILRRSGSLMSAAIDFFIAAREGHAQQSGDGVAADYTISGDTAALHLYGRKVVNQNGNGGNLPARPFWYSGGRASLAARTATESWLKEKFGG